MPLFWQDASFLARCKESCAVTLLGALTYSVTKSRNVVRMPNVARWPNTVRRSNSRVMFLLLGIGTVFFGFAIYKIITIPSINNDPNAKIFLTTMDESLEENYKYESFWVDGDASLGWFKNLFEKTMGTSKVTLEVEDGELATFNAKIVDDEVILYPTSESSNATLLKEISK